MYAKEFEVAARYIREDPRVLSGARIVKLDLHPNHVQLVMDIPAQPGLLFDVNLNLQNRDELHLQASTLWVSWFPCTKQKKEMNISRPYRVCSRAGFAFSCTGAASGACALSFSAQLRTDGGRWLAVWKYRRSFRGRGKPSMWCKMLPPFSLASGICGILRGDRKGGIFSRPPSRSEPHTGTL